MTTNPPTGPTPSHKACAPCRSQKVACTIDEQSPDGACRRCARLGKHCVYTPLQRRKQRKRTDTRVAELEKEMRTMRAALQKKEAAGAGQTADTTVSLPSTIANDTSGSPTATPSTADGRHIPPESNRGPRLFSAGFGMEPPDTSRDVIASGLVSLDTAKQLLDTYRKDLCPIYPIFVLPEDVTAEELRQTRPVLFLALIAAAAGKEHAELALTLDHEILQIYAARQVINSEKSLELVQSLLLSAIWYTPPLKWARLKYIDYVHMATSMAFDLGIGARPTQHRTLGTATPRLARASNVHPLEDVSNPDLSMAPRTQVRSPDVGSLESQRTFLACYVICASISMNLRRATLLPVTSYIRECLESIEHSSAEPSDRTLVACARLNFIVEEICSSFRYYDPGNMALITEMNTQFMLKDFTVRLAAWRSTTAERDLRHRPLHVMYYSVRLYLNEVALHVDHSPEDFQAPFQMGPIVPREGGDEIPTRILADAIADCITSAHGLMNAFMDMEPERCRGLPVSFYIRVSYAAFVLAKLCLSAAHPSSRIGRMLDRSTLDVEAIMDRAVLHVRAIIGTVLRRTPAIFLALLFKLRQWCMNPQLIARSSAGGQHTTKDVVGNTRQLASTGHAPPEKGNTGISTADGTTSSVDDPSPEEFLASLKDSIASHTASAHHDPMEAGRQPAQPLDTSYQDDDARASFSAQPEGIGVSHAPALPTSIDQMQFDTNLWQLFGDLNALPETGMAGLEDWSTTIPTDLMGLPFDWQTAGGGSMPTM